MKTLKTCITVHPINRQLQEKLTIYKSSQVKTVSIGRTMHSLINAGYTKINSYVENDILKIRMNKEEK